MWLSATQLRPGMLISLGGELYRVSTVTHVQQESRRGMMQTKLRGLRTGVQTERRFRSDDRVDRITLDQHQMEFLYQSGDEYHFMNMESYEQVALSTETLGDAVRFLTPNLRLQVDFYEYATPIAVSLPKTVDLAVTETAPGLKGATVTNSLKPATTETGLVVHVPNFVDIGDVIRVDTETRNYLSRVK